MSNAFEKGKQLDRADCGLALATLIITQIKVFINLIPNLLQLFNKQPPLIDETGG